MKILENKSDLPLKFAGSTLTDYIDTYNSISNINTFFSNFTRCKRFVG